MKLSAFKNPIRDDDTIIGKIWKCVLTQQSFFLQEPPTHVYVSYDLSKQRMTESQPKNTLLRTLLTAKLHSTQEQQTINFLSSNSVLDHACLFMAMLRTLMNWTFEEHARKINIDDSSQVKQFVSFYQRRDNHLYLINFSL